MLGDISYIKLLYNPRINIVFIHSFIFIFIHSFIHSFMMRLMQGNIEHAQHGIALKRCNLTQGGHVTGCVKKSEGLYVFCMFVSLVGVRMLLCVQCKIM